LPMSIFCLRRERPGCVHVAYIAAIATSSAIGVIPNVACVHPPGLSIKCISNEAWHRSDCSPKKNNLLMQRAIYGISFEWKKEFPCYITWIVKIIMVQVSYKAAN
jgi:hypothetical protein